MNKEKKKLKNSESVCCEPSQTTCCKSSQVSCCGTSDNLASSESDSQGLSPSLEQEKNNSEKLKLDIYVPLEACSCEWTQFMNLIFSVITPYIKYINHETKSLNSEEARKLKLTRKCVIVDGEKKYTTSYALKKDLSSLLEEKGQI